MTVFERQMQEGALYMRLRQRRSRLDFALAGIAAMQELAPSAYASVSFGKQSVCLAHMLYQIEPEIPMFFLASWESFIIHNFDEVIKSFRERWPINLTIVKADNVSDNELSWKETRDLGRGDLQKMCARADWDGWYWGLVKEESFGRRVTLSYRWEGQPHPTIFKYTDGKYRCCPLRNWDNRDVAAYLHEHDLPVLDLYKRVGLQARTTARVTHDMAEMGGVAFLKNMDIERLNELTARFPELRNYV